MAVAAGDATLEMFGIGTRLEHLLVMVGLDDQIVGIGDEGLHAVGHAACIGDDAEGGVVGHDLKTDTLSAVMRNAEGSDREVAQRDGLVLLQQMLKVEGDFFRYTVVLDDALVYLGCGVDGQMEVAAEIAHRFHMIGMVVGDHDMMDAGKGKAIVSEVFFQRPDAHSRVYDESVGVSKKKVAVATTTATQ